MAHTEGERLMRAYLRERRLPCEEEPQVGGFNAIEHHKMPAATL